MIRRLTSSPRAPPSRAKWCPVRSPASSSHASCTRQFGSVAAPLFVPRRQTIVVPEVRNLSFGGPNLGQEVKVLFATADRSARPVVRAPESRS